MLYHQDDFRADYRKMSEKLRDFRLPVWEEFPDLELYMDQMIVLLNRYLTFDEELAEERTITASMINNYVKMRIMPPPVKKKYGRAHLAYLVIICSLKDALGISVIQKIFPPGMEGEVLRDRYNAFVRNQEKSYHYVADNIDLVALPLLQEQERVSERIHDLVMQVGVSASITKALTEHFITQQHGTEEDEKEDS
ncbi:MAG: DUF1836 domain-containing protein [Ruminococcus sp.]|nr:DUF1836 domain-containing protein [Ruminococcus sp.]